MTRKVKPLKRKPRITDRDIKILEFCQEQRYATLDQMVQAFFPDSRNKYKVPLRCINRLMLRGLLRSCKQGIGKPALYLAGLKGVMLLKERNPQNSLPYVKTVDWENCEQDLWVTDVRRIFEKSGFKWTAGRILKRHSPHKKFSDGKAEKDGHVFSIEVENSRKKHEKYQWIFRERCRDRKDEHILYIVADEKTKAERLRQAKDHKRIYFAAMDELLTLEDATEFVNSDDAEIILEDLVKPEKGCKPDKDFDLFRKADRHYLPLYSH